MKKKEKKNVSWGVVFLLGALIGALFFINIYGIGILDPTNEGWILNYGGDITQHYIGWEFFRDTPWHFPLGLTDGMISGQSVSSRHCHRCFQRLSSIGGSGAYLRIRCREVYPRSSSTGSASARYSVS